LVAALSHFPELEAELELLGSRHNMVLMDSQVDALYILVHLTSDLLRRMSFLQLPVALLMAWGCSNGCSLGHCSFALV
jgi:hypothetical protein